MCLFARVCLLMRPRVCLLMRPRVCGLFAAAGVLSEPWAILALYRAYCAHVPIVCLAVAGLGYDFAGAKQHLDHLHTSLAPAVAAQLTAALQTHMRHVHDCTPQLLHASATPAGAAPPQHHLDTSRDDQAPTLRMLETKLGSLIPAIISVAYNPDGSANALAGTVRDIRDKHRVLEQEASIAKRAEGARAAKGKHAKKSSSARLLAIGKVSKKEIEVKGESGEIQSVPSSEEVV